MNEQEATNYSDGIKDFSEKAYDAFLKRKKSLQITNSRKRPDGVPLIDELVKEQKRFCATPEGKHFMNFIATSLKESMSTPAERRSYNGTDKKNSKGWTRRLVGFC